MMPALYILTSLTTLVCAVLLLRAYGNSKKRLLLWSGLCFAALTISNLFVIVDLVLVPQTDFFTWRVGSAAAGMALLIYGLVWESQ